jgi:myo-inositol 2-dehydrogenase/D-chiro-inositol 1-dehydrogenase
VLLSGALLACHHVGHPRAWITPLVEDTTTPLATAEDGLRATEVAAALIASTRAGGAATKVGAV